VVDRTIEPGTTYRYRVDVADGDGRRPLFETQAISTPAMALTLHQNHPNPFNPTTTIGYYLPDDAAVTLEVYDSSGGWSRGSTTTRSSPGEHTQSSGTGWIRMGGW